MLHSSRLQHSSLHHLLQPARRSFAQRLISLLMSLESPTSVFVAVGGIDADRDAEIEIAACGSPTSNQGRRRRRTRTHGSLLYCLIGATRVHGVDDGRDGA